MVFPSFFVCLPDGKPMLTTIFPCGALAAERTPKRNRRPTKELIHVLVGGIPTPLKNMSSSVGIMILPDIWNNKIHVPNHQPDVDSPRKSLKKSS